MKIFPTFACTALLTLSALTYAQDAQTPEKNETIEAETGAERVVRIQKVIESDQARLTELKKDLEEREDSFKIQSEHLTEREAGLKAMQAQLDDTADPGEAAELQAEIDAYTVKYELVKSLADLAFQAEKTVRDQIQTLETKIGIDQQALDQLLGKTETPQVAEPPVSAPVPAPPAAQAPAQPAPLPGLIPGIPIAPATPGATPGTVQEILPETAEQIEARKEAQKARLEAERAEQAVLSFLERKAALQEQIDLEKSLLGTVEQSKATIDQGVEIRREELADAIAGGDQAKIERAQKNLDTINQSMRAKTWTRSISQCGPSTRRSIRVGTPSRGSTAGCRPCRRSSWPSRRRPNESVRRPRLRARKASGSTARSIQQILCAGRLPGDPTCSA